MFTIDCLFIVLFVIIYRKRARTDDYDMNEVGIVRTGNRGTLGGFIKRAQRTLLDTPWQIIQVRGFERLCFSTFTYSIIILRLSRPDSRVSFEFGRLLDQIFIKSK